MLNLSDLDKPSFDPVFLLILPLFVNILIRCLVDAFIFTEFQLKLNLPTCLKK